MQKWERFLESKLRKIIMENGDGVSEAEASFIHGVRTLGEKCPPLAVRYCNEYNRIIRRKERKY